MTPLGDQTVPDALMGCWRRNWIRFGDQPVDSSVTVIWLQTASGMGDLRLDPQQRPEQTDSSCGITVVENTEPMVTADWLDGATGFAQQPVSNFPEQGLLEWDSPTIMRELAPSGAYVEEWEKLPDSSGEIVHLTALDAPTLTNLYIAGSHYFLAVKAADDERLHEFSYGRQSPGTDQVEIELSTTSSRVGSSIDRHSYDWTTVTRRSS